MDNRKTNYSICKLAYFENLRQMINCVVGDAIENQLRAKYGFDFRDVLRLFTKKFSYQFSPLV